jgi:hypothetical protein
MEQDAIEAWCRDHPVRSMPVATPRPGT